MVNGSFPHCQTVSSVWPWFYLNGNGLIGFQDSLGAGMQPQSLMHSNLKDNISAASHTNGDDEEVAKWTRVLPPAGKVWQASKWRLLQTCDQPSFTFRSVSDFALGALVQVVCVQHMSQPSQLRTTLILFRLLLTHTSCWTTTMSIQRNTTMYQNGLYLNCRKMVRCNHLILWQEFGRKFQPLNVVLLCSSSIIRTAISIDIVIIFHLEDLPIYFHLLFRYICVF